MARGAWSRRAYVLAGVGALLALAAATGTIASCSVGLDFSGLTGGASDAAPDTTTPGDAADGGQLPDTGLQDADAQAHPDGPTLVDAGTDSAPPPFCASQVPAPTLCDDFDTKPLASIWDQSTLAGGAVGHSNAASTSPPTSLRVGINALNAGDPVYVLVAKTFAGFGGKPLHAVIEYDLRVDAMDTKASASSCIVQSLVFDDGTNYYEWQIAGVDVGGAFSVIFAESGSAPDGGLLYDAKDFLASIPLTKWAHIKVDVTVTDVAAPVGAAKVYVDGALVVNKPLKYPLVNAAPRLEIGSSYVTEPSQPWVIFYDNVKLDLQ